MLLAFEIVTGVVRNALVILQGLTFVGLAVVLQVEGAFKLAAAQALLGIVTVLVYS